MKHAHLAAAASIAAALCAPASARSPQEHGTRQLTWADFDVDGHVDAFVVHPAGGVALFRNLGDGRFEDVTATSGLARLSAIAKALWSDYDQDGLPDLFVLSAAGGGNLFQNRAGAFVDVTEVSGIQALGALDASWTDYDGDARPDLALQGAGGHRIYHNLGEAFEAVDLPLALVNAVAPTAGGTDGAEAGEDELERRLRTSDVTSKGTSDGTDDGTGGRSPAGGAPGTGGGGSSWSLGAGSGGSTTIGPGPPSVPMGFCNGQGRALYAFTDSGEEAILADGKTGLRAIGDSGGFGIDASNNLGPGMRVLSTANVGAFVTGGTDSLPALSVIGTGTVPIAGDFRGTLRVGHAGAFGFLVPRVEMGSDADNAGEITLSDASGPAKVEITAQEFVVSGGAQIVLRQDDGTATIILDADHNGSGRIITEVLQITGGADLVESFETGNEVCEPGTVVVIDTENPGELAMSRRAYDKRVAGIVSGANGIRAGLHMGQTGVASSDTPVALSGRVYVKCSTEGGAIEPGDLLTTANLAGHAMKAADSERAFGSVIGKAMSALDDGTGLVLVLVSLQ